MKSKKSLLSRLTRYESSQSDIDYDGIYELVDNGIEDKDIARDLNISESYLKSLKKELDEDY